MVLSDKQNRTKKTPLYEERGLFWCVEYDLCLLDDPEVKKAALSEQFDSASLPVAPHYLTFALEVFVF